MNLTSVKIIKNLCQKYDIRPSKKLGQNFLISKNVVDKMIATADLKQKDVVLEIGPGFGGITFELLKKAGKVIVVEKDRKLIKHIKQIKQLKNLKIINDDILNFCFTDYACLPARQGLRITDYKIISNLPYNIASQVLWKFLYEEENKPSEMILMLQKEVGERILAQPGEMNILAVLCQFYAECKKVSNVSRNNFWPVPEVDSVIIKLKVKKGNSKLDEKELMKIVKIGFSQKRKMLKNNLSKGLRVSSEKILKILKKIGLNEKVRAQNLSVENWISLVKEIEEEI